MNDCRRSRACPLFESNGLHRHDLSVAPIDLHAEVRRPEPENRFAAPIDDLHVNQHQLDPGADWRLLLGEDESTHHPERDNHRSWGDLRMRRASL